MTAPESPGNTVLVLSRPQVSGATHPVEGAHVGVPLVIYDLVTDGRGATVEVYPPLSGTLDPGDVIRLWLKGESTFLDSVIVTDVDAITKLRIPKGRLHPDRINTLFYEILRGSQNIGTSLELTVLYNKIRPALKDRFPEKDGHSELALSLSDAIKNGVGADFVSASVCLSYPYCRAYDTITLKCNGEIMTYTVGPDEAPQPPNPGSAEPITVCFIVDRAFLEKAVRPGGKLDFSCTCTDQLGNTPDTDAVWSATQTVDEDLAGTRFAKPIPLENLEDYPGDDSSLIELDKLGSKPLSVFVQTDDNRIQIGDRIEAVYTAGLTGSPDIVVPLSGTVEGRLGQKLPCVLEVANDKVISGYSVTIVYKVFRGETLIGESRVAYAQVIGEYPIELIVDTTPLTISGQNISIAGSGLPWTLTGVDLPGTFAHRPASGGVPPITFTSSDESIASVDHSGMIRSEGNGKATVTVSDAGGQTKTIDISCENVITYLFNPTTSTHQTYEAWRTSINAHHPITQSGEVIHIDLLVRKFTSHTLTNTWAGPVVVTNPIYAWAFTIPFQHINTLLLTTRCPGLSWRVINSAGAPGSRSEDQ
ncbi:hypothetical protein [Pseudomonas sp. FP1740]|uniref:hypothetical protein n=1 Tax=Pseudomonas sp. FP1740 TaxID=2954078 RepID=UPI0027358693|nr:hypothetical protein [Pseudomonas sp. FP1740]WLG42475.1 hypothetical protein PSH69_16310 [Pseudomonas sp. FP1740]